MASLRLLGGRVLISYSRRDTRTGSRVWYTMTNHPGNALGGRRVRHYYIFCIRRSVAAVGSYWKVIIGPLAISFGERPNKAGR